MAASVAVKSVLQPPVVEPEIGADGEPTGFYLVTIGEGRRQALNLLAKRKTIKKTHPVRCILDTANDPLEISLDENVTRADMHPADQFEAFKRLADERGLSAEEIGARFGVSAAVVRQRLRLGAVNPKLLQLYREEALSLDQLMAFGVSEDHARQEQVYEQLSWNRTPPHIRRAMTEAKVPASDRRVVFVGLEAYAEAGGTLLRDLFSEDQGGWLEDVGLLDRLVSEKLEAVAAEVREREGWKWVEAVIDFPHGLGLSRVYPHRRAETGRHVPVHRRLDGRRRGGRRGRRGAQAGVRRGRINRSRFAAVHRIEAASASRRSMRTVVIIGVCRQVRGFEEAWRPPVKPRRRTPQTILKPGGGASGDEVRARLTRVVNRVPEVMVKVTGRTRDSGHLCAHLDYISRNGELEMEDRDGAVVAGRPAVKELAEDWSAAALADSRRRANTPFSLSLILSMPADTDPATVRDAARAFAREVFADRFPSTTRCHSRTRWTVAFARSRRPARVSPARGSSSRPRTPRRPSGV